MPKITGWTVEQVIEELKKHDPKMLVVVPGGEATVVPVSLCTAGVVYEFCKDKNLYGMTNLMHGKAEDAPKYCAKVPAVALE